MKYPAIYSLIIYVSYLWMTCTVPMKNLYFKDPETSVEIMTRLLVAEDWSTLGRYYYLDRANQYLADSIQSGDYFLRKEKPDLVHPGIPWKYKNPFTPGFKYAYHQSISQNRVIVFLNVRIDQGEGMIQEGKDSYILKKMRRGYQIIPEKHDNDPPVFKD